MHLEAYDCEYLMKTKLSFMMILTFTIGLAAERVLEEEVWIDGDSFYKSIRHKKKQTLYFKEWSEYVDHFLGDDDYYVALQLNRAFDPLPKDGITLPNLQTLAAIPDDSIRLTYLQFLERFGRTAGINHMILPDTSELNQLEKKVIAHATDYAPFYFLHQSSLSRALPESKKAYGEQLNHLPLIWLIHQNQNVKKLRKWSERVANEKRASFYDQLRQSRVDSFLPSHAISDELIQAVFMNGAILVDPEQNFPIRSEVITYIGKDAALRHWLGRYVHVLSHREASVPCVVDQRLSSHPLQEGDFVIERNSFVGKRAGLYLPSLALKEEAMIISQMLFGARAIPGKHTVEGNRPLTNAHFIGYSSPQWEQMDASQLDRIDSLADQAISGFATPGMQLAVLKNGQVVYEKAYGYYTYDSLKRLSNTTLFDIASITKVVATLPAVALLIDQGKIGLDDSLAMHLKSFKGSNKSNITIRELLAHNGGLKAYVPFWSMMLEGDRLDAFYYKNATDEANDVRTYGLEPDPLMADSLKSFIVQSNLIKDPESYTYSDLGFMILHLLVEEVSGLPFDQFLIKYLYNPMGLNSTMFNPIAQLTSVHDIAPTEYDHRYRNYQVWGEVHDRNALVFGGVAGHAGLFSNASDLAKIMSMFLNGGYYGGRQYISQETLNQFNKRYFQNNRRGLGWDKKGEEKSVASKLASDASFGHSGFTGTMVWADPRDQLVYVFLSNRIYPDANNWRLSKLKTRTRIHDVIYESLHNP